MKGKKTKMLSDKHIQRLFQWFEKNNIPQEKAVELLKFLTAPEKKKDQRK